MSKRKAPSETAAATAGKGKQRLAEPEQDFDDEAALESFMDGVGDGSGDLGDDDDLVDNAEQLANALDTEDGADDDLLAGFGDDVGEEGDDGQAAEPFNAEVGDLPDGLAEDTLTGEEEVDLSGHSEMTLPQVRRVAIALAANESLTSVKLAEHSLAVGELKEDDELEWDSEEYTDVDAIIIAELLKKNTTVSRLDLARNQIGDAGAYALAEVLKVNSTLEYLNLESNPFGEVGGAAFVSTLGGNSTLQYLNLKEIGLTSGLQDALKSAWQQGGRGIGLHL